MRRTPRSRVTLVLAPPDAREQHRLGVNSLAYAHAARRLYSCGRDATVRAWDTAGNDATIDASALAFHGHTDWVNDGVLCGADGERLLTASFDTTLKAWDTASGACIASAAKHIDYVKALALAADVGQVVSAGLDKSMYVWDIATLTAVTETPAEPAVALSNIHKASIYAVAVNRAGTVLAAGTPERAIRLWDARSGKRVAKLIGHTDNVKALLLDATGTLCLSGSSDATVKLWDVGQQRCLATYTMHDDSVWTLAADDSLVTFHSGSKDGAVFCTSRAHAHPVLVVKETAPVTKIVCGGPGELWVATTRSDIGCWSDVPRAALERRASGVEGEMQPLSERPVRQIAGSPGMIGQALLNSKRHILTRDTAGRIELWDIMRGTKVRDVAAPSLEKAAQELNEVVWLPNWFSSDVKTGVLAIHFDENSFANGEVFAIDTDLPRDSYMDDTKVSLGQVLLSTALRAWRKDFDAREAALRDKQLQSPDDSSALSDDGSGARDSPAESANGTTSVTTAQAQLPVAPEKDTSLFGRLRSFAPSVGFGSLSPSSNGSRSPAPAAATSAQVAAAAPDSSEAASSAGPPMIVVAPYDLPPETVVVISEESATSATAVGVFRSRVQDIGSDCAALEKCAPAWLVDCVLKERVFVKEMTKYSFSLMSEDEKDMPQLPLNNRRVTASRILRAKKIVLFVLQKLKLDEQDAEQRYEILCNDTVLKPNMNLGTIRNCIWKSSAELQLVYRRRKTVAV